jgi:hypothetical protein
MSVMVTIELDVIAGGTVDSLLGRFVDKLVKGGASVGSSIFHTHFP